MRSLYRAVLLLAGLVATVAHGNTDLLRDEQNRPVSAADLNGRWLLVTFGYSRCPDICPTTLHTLAGALARLGLTRADVTLKEYGGGTRRIEAVRSGEIKATVLQPAAYIARLAVEQAHAFITKGSTGQPEKQSIDCELVTRANADELLAAACGRTRAGIELMLATRFPRVERPTRVEGIATPLAFRS